MPGLYQELEALLRCPEAHLSWPRSQKGSQYQAHQEAVVLQCRVEWKHSVVSPLACVVVGCAQASRPPVNPGLTVVGKHSRASV